MEWLLNLFEASAFWPAMAIVAPVAVGGLVVRVRARRRAAQIAVWRAARRRVREVVPGLVTIEGTWRAPGVVEDQEGGAVMVAHQGEAPSDGSSVVVVGCAVDQVDDPRGSGYRGSSRVWRIDARGGDHLVSNEPGMLERSSTSAARHSLVGGLLFACAIGVMAASAVVAWRASHDELSLGGYSDAQ
jgi:hypothetical protein